MIDQKNHHYGAKDTPSVTPPPVDLVTWICWKRTSDRKVPRLKNKKIKVEARLWIDAREQASMKLKCDPMEVECVLESEKSK